MEVRRVEDEFDQKLSRALEVLGLSEVSIKRKINKHLKTETRINESRDNVGLYSVYFGGSQAEGIGLSSMAADSDWMVCIDIWNVITDMKYWQPSNLVQFLTDSTMVYPGYTRLRPIKQNMPLCLEPSEVAIMHKYTQDIVVTDGNDCFITKRVCFNRNWSTSYIHGPANTTDFGNFVGGVDTVVCLRCKDWPIETREWKTRRRLADWPSREFLRTLENESCFLVPVSSAKSQQPGIEWRYSFSLVERRLVHSWTNKQSKCYVLLKLIKDVILKTIPQCKNTLCSYHLKTIMFWVSELKGTAWWETHSLSQCFMFCLNVLHEHLMAGNCPSYFIPENNLFDLLCGSAERRLLIGVLHEFLKEGPSCLKRCDLVAEQLATPQDLQIALLADSIAVVEDEEITLADIFVKSFLGSSTRNFTNKSQAVLLNQISYLEMLERVKPSFFVNIGLRAGIPAAKGHVGALAFGFLKSNKLPNRVVQALNSCTKRLLQAGTSGDVAMGKLRLANYYFILEEYRKSVNILEDISSGLTPGVIPVGFSISEITNMSERWLDPTNTTLERAADRCCHLPFEQQLQECFQQTLCCPITFSHAERHSTPKPLIIEMFKRNRCPSTIFDWIFSQKWNFAIVDPFVMTYFLQFMCYKKLGKLNHMLVALSNLKWAALHKADMTHTPDTAINLIGYCYMQLGDLDNALKYFIKSLQVNSLMNVAYIHIALLLAKALRR